MGPRDIKILVLSFLIVAILVLFAALLPIYRMPDGTYERHWIWNAPVMRIGSGMQSLSPEDVERLNADPVQKEIIDKMRDMPRTIPIRPIFIGSRYGPGRNPLGYLAVMAVFAWIFFASAKWLNR